MSFIGLDLRQEMAMFNVINGKAKGLSSSLTDYHESRLVDDLICHAPHLYIARRLNEDSSSPWHQMIRYGGETTSGLKRRTSLRMMQKAVTEFLSKTKQTHHVDPDVNYEIIASFWLAIRHLFPVEWSDHRHNLLTKGVGLYSLMQILTDFVSSKKNKIFSEDFFIDRIKPLVGKVDWSSKGEFASANGRKGANEVYLAIKEKLEG
jgi:DNA sulfur modification protein DndB